MSSLNSNDPNVLEKEIIKTPWGLPPLPRRHPIVEDPIHAGEPQGLMCERSDAGAPLSLPTEGVGVEAR